MKLGLRRTEEAFDPDASVLPLINIVFLLLIFFMLTGRMTAMESLTIAPPYSDSDQLLDNDAARVVVVTADGRTAMDGETLPRDAVVNRIRLRLDASPKLTVQLKADARANSRELVLLMEQLRAAGVEHLQLVTVGRR